MTDIEILHVLDKLKKLVSARSFEFVLRKDSNKRHISSTVASIVVQGLTANNFEKKELDRNGSGDFIFVFISEDGTRYYIKFKLIDDESKVKFISFHEAQF